VLLWRLLLVVAPSCESKALHAQCDQLQLETRHHALMTAMEEALSNAGILHIIFTYEGAGRWLFIPPVCKLWKQCYEQLDPTPLHASYPQATIRLTAYGAVFRSPSRLQLACENGLQALFATDLLQLKAGAWCDLPTLLAAQQLGLQVTDSFMRFAAAAGRLDVLQLLHTDQGVPLPANISNFAAARARMDVLRWLQDIGYAFTPSTANNAAAKGHAAVLVWLLEQQCPVHQMQLCGTAARYGSMHILALLQERDLLPPQALRSRLLSVAGAADQLAAAQWLRQRGANWPAVLCHNDKPWTGATLEWARAEGCTAATEW
jgi:hypothetical protein